MLWWRVNIQISLHIPNVIRVQIQPVSHHPTTTRASLCRTSLHARPLPPFTITWSITPPLTILTRTLPPTHTKPLIATRSPPGLLRIPQGTDPQSFSLQPPCRGSHCCFRKHTLHSGSQATIRHRRLLRNTAGKIVWNVPRWREEIASLRWHYAEDK